MIALSEQVGQLAQQPDNVFAWAAYAAAMVVWFLFAEGEDW